MDQLWNPGRDLAEDCGREFRWKSRPSSGSVYGSDGKYVGPPSNLNFRDAGIEKVMKAKKRP